MNNDFYKGFIKSAIAKGYSKEEAELIFKEAGRGDFAKKFLPEFKSREPGHGIFNSLSDTFKGSPVADSVAGNLRSKKMELGKPLVIK